MSLFGHIKIQHTAGQSLTAECTCQSGSAIENCHLGDSAPIKLVYYHCKKQNTEAETLSQFDFNSSP